MPNIFKKISRGFNNFSKKVDHNASNFFKKLPTQVEHVVKATNKGLNQGLDAVGGVAKQVGNALEKAGPALALGASMIAPEFAVPITAAITGATALSRNIQTGAHAGKAMTNQLAQQVTNKANSVMGQAQRGFANGSANLQNQVNNGLLKGQSAYNGAVSQAANSLTIH